MTTADEVEDRQPRLRRFGPRDAIVSVLGLGLVVVLIAWGLPTILDTSWSAIWAQLSRVRAGTALAMAALLLAGLLCYTLVLMGALPGLGRFQALRTNAITSMVGSTMPLGAAVSIGLTWMIWRTWGFSKRAISSAILVTSVSNLLARVALPVVGCLVLVVAPIEAPQVVVNGAMIAGALGTALVLVCSLVILSDRVASWVTAVFRTVLSPVSRKIREGRGVDRLITDQRSRIADVVGGGWLLITLGMVGQFAFLFGLYWLAARVVGLDLPLAELLCAYSFRQLLTIFAITPGGLGVTEVGTAGLLVLFGGDAGAASATALLYAIYAHALVVPFGVASLGAWWLGPGRAAAATGSLSGWAGEAGDGSPTPG